jgi:hypothetical protein
MYKKKDRSDQSCIIMKATRVFNASVRTIFNFLQDISSIPKTDSTAIEARILRTYHESRRLIYIRNHVTFPMQDRDSVFLQHDVIADDESYAILAGHSIETPIAPPVKNIERVFLLASGFLIEALEEPNKSRVTYLINLESKTSAPTSLVHIILKKTMKTKLDIGHFFASSPTEKERAKVAKAEKRAAKVLSLNRSSNITTPSASTQSSTTSTTSSTSKPSKQPSFRLLDVTGALFHSPSSLSTSQTETQTTVVTTTGNVATSKLGSYC